MRISTHCLISGHFPGEVEFKQSSKKAEKDAKKAEKKEAGDKKTFKGTAKAVTLAKQLSPRTQRKKEKLLNNTAQLKVGSRQR